jgi:hypothetical protein
MKPKPEITTPTLAEVPALEERLAAITAEITALEAEGKTIKARLQAYSLAHAEQHEALKDDKREGRKLALPAGRVDVIFQSDLIIASFPDHGAKHKELIGILCGADGETEVTALVTLKRFFGEPSKWENRYDNGLKFRAAVAEHLGSKVAGKFISACTQVDKHGVKKSNISFDIKPKVEVKP